MEKYWLDLFAEVQGHQLFFAKPREEFSSPDWESSDLDMEEWEKERLQKITGGSKDGKFILLLAGFYITYFRFSNAQDVVIASNGSKLGMKNLYRIRSVVDESARSIVKTISDQWRKYGEYDQDTFLSALGKVQKNQGENFDTLTRMAFSNQSSELDPPDGVEISLNLFQNDNDLKLEWKYNKGVVCGEFVRSFQASYQVVLKQMLENIDTRVTDFNLLEKGQIEEVIESSQSQVVFHYTENYMSLFDRQVERSMELPSVHTNDSSLSYVELNECVGRLANYLKQVHNIEKGDRVGVLLSRSEKNVICMLALWRCGACYVPLDYHLPIDRLNYLLDDINPSVVFSENHVMEQGVLINCTYVNLDVIKTDGFSTHTDQCTLEEEDIAYIIYTSGSTGTPKGISQKHGMLFNLIEWQTHHSEIDQGLRYFLYTSFVFDVSIQDMCFILRTGGTLFIASEDIRLDFRQVRKYLLEYKIEGLYFPYSVLNSFFQINNAESMKGHALRHIVTGGEQVIINQGIEQFLQQNKQTKLHNQYGPSETHVVTNFTLRSDDSTILKRTPIGTPVANTAVYILDEKQEIVPFGVTGEAYIGGANVAKGYWNLPRLTSERFISLDLHKKNELVYRSGDIVRRWPNGVIEYVGREDDQIKIKGYRIELGEIQKMLLKHKEVSDAITISVEDANSDKHLTVYYSAKDEISKADLIDYLETFLPSYMIPSFLIRVDAIPLTSNGKLDKTLLPNPFELNQKNSIYAKPETGIQEDLVEIWEEILGVSKIGIDDDFFELGGYSLKAIKLLGRLGQKFDADLELTHIFKLLTIRKLSEKIESSKGKGWSPIPVTATQNQYPLSRGQYRLWLLHKFGNMGLSYLIPMSYKIKKQLNVDALVSAIQLLISRHEVLRTVIREVDGTPYQFIIESDQCQNMLESIDHGIKSSNQVQELLDQRLDTYDLKLDRGPWFFCSINKCGGGEYIIQFIMHHIITDAWSLEVMFSEIMNNYNHICRDKSYVPSPLKIQHKDYAAWQEEFIERNQDRNFWMDHIGNNLPVLNLSSNPRPSSKTQDGAHAHIDIAARTFENLKKISKRKGCSLFTTLTTLIQVFLSKRTGQSDIIIGMPVAGRHHPDLLDQLGFYVNLLPLRATIDHQLSFEDYLDLIHGIIDEAFEHQQYPFDQMVEDLQMHTESSRSPMFDIVVNYLNNSDMMEIDSKELDIQPIPSISKTSKFDLSFIFIENKGLTLSIEYNSNLFSHDDVQGILSQVATLSSSMLDTSDNPMQEHALLTKNESEIIASFQESVSDYPREQPVHKIFESNVAVNGDAIALICESRSLTYKELNERANQVAYFLQKVHGVQRGDLVAIIMDRSEWVVISMLAVLKVGAGYLPILSQNPMKRIELILESSRVKVILSDYSVKNSFDLGQVYVEDSESYTGEQYDDVEVKAEDVAYIMYTSGSTGQPKGVIIPHRGIVRLVKNTNYTDFSSEDRMLQLSNVAFDAATFEIYGALLNGASLYILPFEDMLAPDKFNAFIKNNGITSALLITPLFNNLMDECPEIAGHFRKLYFGGEASSKRHVLKAMEHVSRPDVLVNLYGPTESTTVSTYHLITEADQARTEIPIGKPISNTSIYILDDILNRVPIGTTGEICVGGDGLALGYFGAIELTNQKFIEHPVKSGQVLYLTGDLGYWQEDGTIAYRGRKDNQVKIRGYRIECGDVENAMNKAGARHSLVIPYNDEIANTKNMVAYVNGIEPDDMKSFKKKLSTLLPDYMIPSVIQGIDEFPLNTNGKIDHKKLPPIEWPSSASNYVAPETDVEKELARIWRTILSVESIGVDDNFFELGGNSLKAVKTIKASKAVLNDFKVADLYNYPTIRGLTKLGDAMVDEKEDVVGLDSFNL